MTLENDIFIAIKKRNSGDLKWIFSQEYFTVLNLTGSGRNTINAKDLEFLASILANGQNHLVSVLLPDNNIGDEGAEWIIDILVNNQNIIHVDLSNNHITYQGAYYLDSNLQHTNAIYLNLHDNIIEEDLLENIQATLEENGTVRNLQLASRAYEAGEYADLTPLKDVIDGTKINLNAIGYEGFLALAELLKHYRGSITHLNIGGNGIGEEDDEGEGIAAIASILSSHPEIVQIDLSDKGINSESMLMFLKALEGRNIEYLDVSGNSIGNKGAIALLEALSGSRTLKKLYLGNSNLDQGVVDALLKFLAANSQLKELDISNNHLGDEALIDIVKALNNNTALKAFDIAGCGIGSTGIIALSEWLKHNTAVTKLDISNNEDIGDHGFSALIEMLTINNIISILDLSNTNISPKSIVELSEMLKTNSALKRLGLASNHIDDKELEEIAGALIFNGALRRLSLEENNFNDEGASALAEMLPENKVLLKLNIQGNGGIDAREIAQLLIPNRAAYETQMLPMLLQLCLPKLAKDTIEAVYDFLGKLGIDGILPAIPRDAYRFALARKLGGQKPMQTEEDDVQKQFAQYLLETHHMILHSIPSDDQCMFHAVADQLARINGGRTMTYDELKKLAINYVKAHQEDYKDFLVDTTIEEYIDKMLQDSEWGDQNILHALAHELGINIVIISNLVAAAPTHFEVPEAEHTIYLGHIAEVHYVSLHPAPENVDAPVTAEAEYVQVLGVIEICNAFPVFMG